MLIPDSDAAIQKTRIKPVSNHFKSKECTQKGI